MTTYELFYESEYERNNKVEKYWAKYSSQYCREYYTSYYVQLMNYGHSRSAKYTGKFKHTILGTRVRKYWLEELSNYFKFLLPEGVKYFEVIQEGFITDYPLSRAMVSFFLMVCKEANKIKYYYKKFDIETVSAFIMMRSKLPAFEYSDHTRKLTASFPLMINFFLEEKTHNQDNASSNGPASACWKHINNFENNNNLVYQTYKDIIDKYSLHYKFNMES